MGWLEALLVQLPVSPALKSAALHVSGQLGVISPASRQLRSLDSWVPSQVHCRWLLRASVSFLGEGQAMDDPQGCIQAGGSVSMGLGVPGEQGPQLHSPTPISFPSPLLTSVIVSPGTCSGVGMWAGLSWGAVVSSGQSSPQVGWPGGMGLSVLGGLGRGGLC